jgi:hypothetical protein
MKWRRWDATGSGARGWADGQARRGRAGWRLPIGGFAEARRRSGRSGAATGSLSPRRSSKAWRRWPAVRTATGSQRPPHRGQTSTSMANTRFRRAAQERPNEPAAAASPRLHQVLSADVRFSGWAAHGGRVGDDLRASGGVRGRDAMTAQQVQAGGGDQDGEFLDELQSLDRRRRSEDLHSHLRPAPTALRRTAREVALQGRHIGGLEEPRSPGGCRGHRVLAD